MPDQLATVPSLLETRAKPKPGWQVVSRILDNLYHSGNPATPAESENLPLVVEQLLPPENYQAVPES